MKTNLNFDFETTKSNNESQEEILLKNIKIAKQALDNAYNNFDVVTDPDLIDSCIYEVKAIQMKYQYLINQAKEMNLIAKIHR
ncbi:MAG: YaaL family protein [Vallitalea sp.]|jgi:hypothetical protein|nr:YaaL family protein [Vallitalea sp.]